MTDDKMRVLICTRCRLEETSVALRRVDESCWLCWAALASVSQMVVRSSCCFGQVFGMDENVGWEQLYFECQFNYCVPLSLTWNGLSALTVYVRVVHALRIIRRIVVITLLFSIVNLFAWCKENWHLYLFVIKSRLIRTNANYQHVFHSRVTPVYVAFILQSNIVWGAIWGCVRVANENERGGRQRGRSIKKCRPGARFCCNCCLAVIVGAAGVHGGCLVCLICKYLQLLLLIIIKIIVL